MSRLTVQQALDLGVREHQQGRLSDAMAMYVHVLGVEPANPDALHLAGMVHLAEGRLAQAIEMMEKALKACKAGATPPHFRSNLANAYREIGELERAEAEYRSAIASGGGSAEVFNNLGLTLLSLGRPAWAIDAFESSLARRPRSATTFTNLSVACLAAGAAAEALRSADEALAIDGSVGPAVLARASALAALDRRAEAIAIFETLKDSPLESAALCGWSDALIAEGRPQEAIELSRRAVQRNDADASAWSQHGANLARAALIADAEAAFARAVELRPRYAPAHVRLGAMQLTLGKFAEAAASLRVATELDASHAEAWRNLSVALLSCREAPAAVVAAERALVLDGRSSASIAAFGAALLGARRFREAHEIFRELVRSAPSADAWNGLGVSLERLGRIEDARDAYANAFTQDPSHVVARLNHAECLLLLGDFVRGWDGYEVRLEYLRGIGVQINDSGRPRWAPGAVARDGQPPVVLLVAEQGLGDAIQFVRYARIVRQQARRVIVQAPEAVRRLIATVEGVDEVIGLDDQCEHDFAIHAMSLPRVLGTKPETIPGDVPYVSPESALFEAWRQRLGRRQGFRVALAWAGSPSHSHDASRSIPLQKLEPLAAIGGVEWFSVQKGYVAEQLSSVPDRWKIADLGGELGDLSDTAAALANMDLVITVDTSVAHLAGALGARTWTLLAQPPEWRWMLERRDSPWYPTMTLFRQREIDDWSHVIARIRHRLERLVRSKAGSSS